ncbi:MAG TPA: GH92 family glycosyl hydrolase, partial [Bacteroidales bacterium]|nr:GH92 family glycosyl hydrolase [Bacteroidales bacterium]
MKFRIFIVPVLCFLLSSCGNENTEPVDFVNPDIGGMSPLLETTVPLVDLPDGMMRVYRTPGSYLPERVDGFPFILCGHRNGTAGLLMPAAGKVSFRPADWQSSYNHDFEVKKPYFYSVWLKDPDINMELAVARRSAFYRIRWNRDDQKNLMVALSNKGRLKIVDNNTVEGYEVYHGKVKVFFSILTDKQFISDTVYNDNGHRMEDDRDIKSKTPVAALTFDLPAGGNLDVKYSVSFVSQEQARKNLAEEIPAWDFTGLEQKGREAWNEALGKIEVKGGSKDQKTVFYTALYRNYERMVNISEDGKYYSGYDDTIHSDNGVPFYADDWMWDTYRASHPLQAMLNPVTEGVKIESYVRMYEQSGWMPSFPILFGD